MEQNPTSCIVKEGHVDEAKQIFEGTNIPITTGGGRYLGVDLGAAEFKEEYVRVMVSKWCGEIERLANSVLSQPHAAFMAFTCVDQHN